ncbi:hypothetical protein INT47_005908 [Mucor saturninus]|uniref:Uncharacterized protein n=1 Tax=Mucor saturninus TaxID=64648 RepID=A0A8H7R6Y2_9FUNG|nr:hypothetical protein INT47_005908 [Mucor saturninus]
MRIYLPNDPIQPPNTTALIPNYITKYGGIAKEVIEATCSTIADDTSNQIHFNSDACASNTIADSLAKILNDQLSKNNSPPGNATTTTGTCQSTVSHSTVEWAVETSIADAPEEFTVTCASCTSCYATFSDIVLNLTWSSDQLNGMSKRYVSNSNDISPVNSSSNLSTHTNLFMSLFIMLLLIRYLHQ